MSKFQMTNKLLFKIICAMLYTKKMHIHIYRHLHINFYYGYKLVVTPLFTLVYKMGIILAPISDCCVLLVRKLL